MTGPNNGGAGNPSGRAGNVAVRQIEDVPFVERETGPLLLDLVLPEGRGPFPVVLWLHGGGWFTGDRKLRPDLRRFFAERGFAMASADYRLSGQAPFPAQLFDVRSAVRFLRREAGRYGLDPEAIGAWGASAGGHLAALAGLTGGRPVLDGEPESGDARVQAVSDGYGPVDLAAVVAAGAESAPPQLSGANAPEARLLGGPPAELPELAERASPLSYVSGGAPPFHILHGTADALVPHGQSELLHDALVRAGASSELYLIDGFGHGFLNPAGTSDLDRVMDFGHLEAAPGAPAELRTARGSSRVGVSFDLIGDFFAQHLR